MRFFDVVLTRARGLFRRDRIDRELEAELAYHLERQTAENVARGMPPDAAHRAAILSIGRPDDIKDAYRAMRRLPILETVWRDIRYAARGLKRARVFSAIAVATLALGIGANAVIFSVLNATVLRPVDYPNADRLMILQLTVAVPGRGANPTAWSFPKFEDLRAYATAFETIEGFVPRDVNLASDTGAERVKAELVTGGYFSILGVQPLLGRTIEPGDDRKNDPHAVAVISERVWRQIFGGDSAIVGREVRVNRELVTIVGVAPATFRGESGSAEMWVPVTALAGPLMNNPARLRMRMAHWLTVVARRIPDATARQADADLKNAVRRMEKNFPSGGPAAKGSAEWSATAVPLTDAKVDPMLRRSLVMLLGAVGFVLLITCINLASLMLSRAITRQREIAVRLAIGASRAALVRHVLTETVLLGVLGGGLSILVASWGLRALAILRPEAQLGTAAPFVRRITVDSMDILNPWTVAFTFGLALAAGLLFGVLPAIQTTRLDLNHVIKSESPMPSRHGIRRLTVRNSLLVLQMALAIVLLAGAGLMLRSLSRALTIRLGFEPDRVLTLRLDPPATQYGDDARRLLFENLTARVSTLPGVEAAAVANTLPLRGQNETTIFRINGVEFPGDVNVHMVSPQYFAALHVPLIRGRYIADRDTVNAPRVALVNDTFARRQWPDADPIGQRIAFGLNDWSEPGQEAIVVGIVGDVKYQLVDMAVGLDAYLSSAQRPPSATSFAIRTSTDPRSLVSAVRQQIAAVDPALPAFDVMTMSQTVEDATARWRFSGILLTVFAVLATLLTAAGIYGMLACSVAARTREIGVRMALGAERVKVVRLVMLEATRIAAVGLCLGLPAAVIVGHSLRSLLYDVQPVDPRTIAAVTVVSIVTALIAATLPAWRAARVDPMIALRHD